MYDFVLLLLLLDIDDVIEDDKESESGFTVNFENNQCTLSSEHFSHIQNKIQSVTKQVYKNNNLNTFYKMY